MEYIRYDDQPQDQFLRDSDLTPVDKADVYIYGTKEASERSFFQKFEDFFIDQSRVSLKEKAYFYHLMSVMIDAGVSIVFSLNILARTLRHVRLKRVLFTIAYEVETEGKSLSNAMARFPDVFREGEVEVIRSGEMVGNLDVCFQRLSVQVTNEYTLRQKLKAAFTYPVVVIVVLFLALVVIVSYVVPNLAAFFQENSTELPTITRILIVVSEMIRDFWWLLLLFLVSILIALSFYIRTEKGRFQWDYWKLTFPFFGSLKRNVILGRLLRLLGTLVNSGIPITRTVEILMRSAENDVYKRKLHQVLWNIHRGERLAESFSQAPLLFPDMTSAVLDIGERAGTLDVSATKLAEHYDQEVIYSVQEITSILEPLLIVIVGIGVLFTALAILTPIFSLSNVVM